MQRAVFVPVRIPIYVSLLLSLAGCGFFGSQYSTLQGSGANFSTQAGPATQLGLTGPSTVMLGTCSGPFQVNAIDSSGRPSAAFETAVNVQISDSTGAIIYGNSSCASDSQQPIGGLEIAAGANGVPFYISGVRAGNAALTATITSLLPAALPVNYIPGPPRAVRWTNVRTIPAFSCAQVFLELVDITQTPTTVSSAVSLTLSSPGATGLGFYTSGTCQTTASTLTIPANVSSRPVWVYASRAGDFTLRGAPAQAELAQAQGTMAAVNSASPKLVISPAAASATSNQCIGFNLDSLAQNGDPLATRIETPVVLQGAESAVNLYSGDNCTGTATRNFIIPVNESRVRFWAKAAIASTYDLSASAPYYVSGQTRLTVSGGAPASAFFAMAISEARANRCSGPFRLQLRDAAGNATNTPTDLNVAFSSDTPAGSTKFYTSADCSTPDVLTSTMAAQSGSVAFYVKPSIPGSVMVTATPNGFSPSTQRVSVLFSTGNPARLALELESAAPYKAGACIVAKAKSLDTNGYPLEVADAPIRIQLSSDSTTSRFFSGASCQALATQAEIAVGSTEVRFSFLDTRSRAVLVQGANAAPGSTTVPASLSVAIVANSPAQLVFEGMPSPVFRGQCNAVVVVLKDAFDNETPALAPFSVQLDSSNGFSFHSTCGSAPISSIPMNLGASRLPVNFRATATGALRLVAIGPVGISAAYAPIEVLPPPATSLVLTPSSSPIVAGACVSVGLSSVDVNNQLALYDDLVVQLSSSRLNGIFFGDASCGTAVTSVALVAGRNPVQFYVRSTQASQGPFTLNALANDGKSANVSVSVVPATAAKLVLQGAGPGTVRTGGWEGPYSIVQMDAFNNAVNALNDIELSLVTVSQGAVISSLNNGTIAPVKIVAGQSSSSFYIKFTSAGNYSLALKSPALSSNSRSICVQNPPGVVLSVSPNSGPTTGDTPITLTGGPFLTGAGVLVGGSVCNVTALSGTQITCRTPAHAAGWVDISVTNPQADPFVLANAFNFTLVPPTISLVTPNRGTKSTPVEISGTGFQNGVSVSFGGSACIVQSSTSTLIRCVASEHAPGAVNVVIRNPDSGEVSLTNGFNYLAAAPTVISLSPSWGSTQGGTQVVVTGTNFETTTQVWIGAANCANVQWNSATSLTCTLPPGTAGWVAVTAQNPNSDPSVLANGFEYVRLPTLTSISPTSGRSDLTTPLVLTGTNFDSNLSVKIGSAPCSSLTISSPTRATCTAPAQPVGAYLVNLFYRGTAVPPCSVTFTSTAPPTGNAVITAVSPRNGPVGGGTLLRVTGQNLHGGVRLFIGSAECLQSRLLSPTELTCVTAPHTPGAVWIDFREGMGAPKNPNMTFTYEGSVASCSCSVFAQISRACGDDHEREWAAAWAPMPAGLTLSNGMTSAQITSYLQSPRHNPSGYFPGGTNASCNAGQRAPTNVNRAPFPQSVVVSGRTLALFTDGNLGSIDCPAYYSMYYSPLIIDLLDQGIALSAPNKGVRFDILGDGTQKSISWPMNPQNSVFLTLPDANGQVQSIHQLFGNNTKGPDGRLAPNGFEALAKYDLNKDKRIDAQDAVYSKLRLWSDLNRNGRVDGGELSTLAEKGVKSFDLKYENISERNDFYGNETKQRSVLELQNGEMRRVFDIWFVPG